jgi:hypothetical protein
MLKNFSIYRMYLRISREILDKIQTKFYQFDLYRVQFFEPTKQVKIDFLRVLLCYRCLDMIFKNVNFGLFV